ncbi:hypothetical protein ACLJJ6_04905 [Pediococcus siamensis]|uniref:hypothetical protein n=1 Tax=Pediococcus siamensis TaxID=381829 RepID=UPI0039A32365
MRDTNKEVSTEILNKNLVIALKLELIENCTPLFRITFQLLKSLRIKVHQLAQFGLTSMVK